MSLTKTSNALTAVAFADMGTALGTSNLFRVTPRPPKPDGNIRYHDNGEYVTLYYLSWNDEGAEVEVIGYEQDGKPISREELDKDFILVTAYDLAMIHEEQRYGDALDRAIDRAQDERDSR